MADRNAMLYLYILSESSFYGFIFEFSCTVMFGGVYLITNKMFNNNIYNIFIFDIFMIINNILIML